MTRGDIYKALKQVIDPELGVNIVDLGLIYDVKVNETKGNDPENPRVYVLLTLTTPGCPLAGSFDFMIRSALHEIPNLDVEEEVKLELTFDPPWTPGLMTEELRAEFGVEEW